MSKTDSQASPGLGKHSYLLVMRIWREEMGTDAFEWRAFVQHASRGEAVYIRSWTDLASFLETIEANDRLSSETK